MSLAGGINTYTYVGGNSIRYVDKSGLNAVASGYAGAGVGTAVFPGIGTVVGGVVGLGVGIWATDAAIDAGLDAYANYKKPPKDAHDPNGAKAPGKPGEKEGFKDPKGGEDWVPNPNPGKGGSGWGWRDKNGDVWCPTGQGDIAHGDPHWDVQLPNGDYKNIRPKKP